MAYPTNSVVPTGSGIGFGEGLSFNPKPSTVMHIDLNSCFATIEQQANPHLRGKPVAVAAYTTPSGCIIAPSVEAKKFGIRVGMRVKDGRLIHPGLVVLSPDPNKYRAVHLRLRKIVAGYTNNYNPKSIDEFVLKLEGYPSYKKGILNVAKEIKKRIKQEVGDWITVSVGVAPNRFLAKLGSSLNKPDGLDEINRSNFTDVFKSLELTDFCGIKLRNTARLNSVGIYTPIDFYNATPSQLKAAFNSINAYYWYLRIRGWEIDDVEFGRRSYGNSYALPRSTGRLEELFPILQKLVEKTGMRLRRAGYKTRGVHISMLFRSGLHWHRGVALSRVVFDSRDIYKEAFRILNFCPYRKPVHSLAVSCFNLTRSKKSQLELFADVEKKRKLTEAVDSINERWGNFVITPARMLWARESVPDRIAFGGVKELEEFTLQV